MIDYSVSMMASTALSDQTPKAYAKSQVSEIWSLEKFSRHIADHNGVFSRGTVKGVISDMCECLVEQLLNGNKIQLGELGSFSISLSSEGAESIDSFTAKNIKGVNIVFTPGEDFENLIEQAEFNQVSTRAVQKATLKAVKAGEDNLDLAALRSATANAAGSDTTTEPDDEETDGQDDSGATV